MNMPAIRAKSQKLAELQSALDLSDQAMAEKIGCSRQTWKHAVEGENVSAGFIAKVSKTFQVPFDTYFHIVHAEVLAA